MLGSTPGGVAEWLKAAVSKTVNGGFVVRGFESLPLRLSQCLWAGCSIRASRWGVGRWRTTSIVSRAHTCESLEAQDACRRAAIPLFGPVVASVISFVSLAVVDLARGERFYRLIFNASTYALAGAAAGWIFLAAGGRLGEVSDAHPGPLAAAVATHAVVTTGLIGLALASARRIRLVGGTLRYAREVAPTSLAEYSLGLVLARLCAATPGVVPLLAPLFIAVYRAHSSAVRLATETKQALRGLADIVDARDPYTFAHSERVADYATRLAEALDLPDWRVSSITRAGRLHDLGKLTIDVAILTKPGPLTDSEFDELRAHPAMSARLLAPFSFIASERSLIEYHHERFDGNGYYRIPRERLPVMRIS